MLLRSFRSLEQATSSGMIKRISSDDGDKLESVSRRESQTIEKRVAEPETSEHGRPRVQRVSSVRRYARRYIMMPTSKHRNPSSLRLVQTYGSTMSQSRVSGEGKRDGGKVTQPSERVLPLSVE